MRKLRVRAGRFCAFLIGMVFFVSGFLKLMDPVGGRLLMGEYLSFLHLGSLEAVSQGMATFFAIAETMTGAALMAGIWRRVVSWTAMLMLGLFTMLTLALWIWNPAMDCGCFGEAVHLTHAQSFIKNVALVALAVPAFFPMRRGLRPAARKYVVFSVVAAGALFVGGRAMVRLPIVDFTDYAPGRDVEGRLEGVADGNVYTVSVYDSGKLGFEDWIRVSESVLAAFEYGFVPLVYADDADNVPEDIRDFLYIADKRTMMALNRSNGGAALIEDGTVRLKWHLRQLPGEDDFPQLVEEDPVEAYLRHALRGRLVLEGALIVSLAAFIVI